MRDNLTNLHANDPRNERDQPPPHGEVRERRKPQFRQTSAVEIMNTSYEPIQWVVPGYVAEGFNVLAGRQKIGKSWLAVDWASAVAVGGIAMGSIPCDGGDVIYLDLENGPRRIKSRIETLFPNECDRPDLSRLDFVTEAPQLGPDFVAELDRWRESVDAPRLIVIDVLQRIKPPGVVTRNAYENDYAIWSPLQRWATRHHLAVVGIHHLKKGGADDPLEALSGSNGLGAVADTVLVLNSDQNGKTLYVRGRDIEERDTAVIFNGGHWITLGEASSVKQSAERKVIVEVLSDNFEGSSDNLAPMTPQEIATALGLPVNNIKQLLFKMAKAGDIWKPKRGYYAVNSKENR